MIQAALGQPIVRVETRQERRGSPRFQVALPASFHNFPSAGDSPEFQGKVINMSGRGIYFVADTPLTPGSRLVLTISLPGKDASSGSVLARARVRVARSEKVWHEGERKVGVVAEIEHYCL